jgi:membrane protease subunit HflK
MNDLSGIPTPKPDPSPVTPAPEVAEDAGSQALSEALRSSFAIVKLLMIGLVIVFFGSGFFTVRPQEKALILRFGRPVGEGDKALLGPGAHWAFPSPVDEVIRIPIGQVQTATSTIGWYYMAAGEKVSEAEAEYAPRSLNPARDGYLLTGDQNIIHVRGTLLYRISEPGLQFTFNFLDASNLVQNALNNALVYAAANLSVDDALKDIATFKEKVSARLQYLIARQQLGVVVDQINLVPAAPRRLKADFERVLAASIKREQMMNQARSEENQTISRARSEAAVRINGGISESNQMVQFIAADAQRFNELLPAYQRNPELFVRQRQLDTLQRVLTNAESKWVLPRSDHGKPIDLRLQLNREAPKPKPVETPPDADHH